nr:phenolic glucoside malonyltransferase 1-like [Malus domestica]
MDSKGLTGCSDSSIVDSKDAISNIFVYCMRNLTWPQESSKPLLSCVTGDAVSLTIAESDTDFHRLTSSNNFDIKAKDPHHVVLDGLSAFSFFNLWGYPCKHGGGEGEGSPPSPSYDRKVITDPAGLQAIYLNEWLRLGGPNNRSLMPLEISGDSIRGTFEFTGAKIQMLRRSVMAAMMAEEKKKQADHDSKLLHLSTFSLTCAYTWGCFVRAGYQNR